MRHVRLDLIFVNLFERLGPTWAVASLLLVLALCLLRLDRAFGLGLLFLTFLQVWYAPLYYMCSRLRWWVIGILGVRGLFLLLSTKGVSGETRLPQLVLGGLAGWAVLSTVWSDAPIFTFLVAGTFVAGVLVSFVLIWRLADTVDVVQLICRWSLVVSLGLYGASFAVYLWAIVLQDPYMMLHTGVGARFSGVFGNPNGCGVFGALLLPLVFAAPRETLGGLAKFRVPAVTMLLLAVLMSGSRSAFVGAGIALGVVLLYRFRAGAAVFGGLIVATTVTLLIATPVEAIDMIEAGPADRLIRVETLASVGDRVEIWQQGWAAAMESPWIGSGWSISRVLDGRDLGNALALGRVSAGTNLHNAHLQVLVDVGVVGLGLFWWFGLLVALASLRVIARAADDRRNVVNVVLVGSLAVMWGDTFVHGWIFSIGSPATLVFWACCALILKADDAQRRADAADAAKDIAARPLPSRIAVRPAHNWPTPSPTHG